MPQDVNALIRQLFPRPSDPHPPRPQSLILQPGGVVALDYGDDDHVFQVTLERVPRRRWLPEQPVPIGRVDGVDAVLVGVTVDAFVHVHLAAVQTPERDRLTRNFQEAFRQWAATAGQTQQGSPEQPARRLMDVTVRVEDARGTDYVFQHGQCGGTGTGWEATQSFSPRPPAGVTELRLRIQAPDQPQVTLLAPLPAT